jgi:hypothetical protein
VREVDSLKLSVLDMAQHVAEAQSRLTYKIEETDAQITTPAHWPAAVGYGPWVVEVWANYISNALKYGGRPEDGVPPRVALGFSRLEGGPEAPGRDAPDLPAEIQDLDAHVAFWVRDNGPGLTPAQQQQLFTPFERLHDTRAEGHGLGLSIVHRIVSKLGGDVGVVSQVGEGSTFYFTLPTEAACPADTVTPVPPTRRVDTTRRVDVSEPSVEETRPPKPAQDTSPLELPSLEAIPPELIDRLRQATIQADLTEISDIITQIGVHAPQLAHVLRKWADNFDHDAILALIEG